MTLNRTVNNHEHFKHNLFNKLFCCSFFQSCSFIIHYFVSIISTFNASSEYQFFAKDNIIPIKLL